MIQANSPQQLARLWQVGTPCPYDEILDVRSPVEYAEDHIPGAVNIPVLSDAEREEVGTIHCQQSGFAARKIGASFVSANIARHLREHFSDKPKEYRPFIYCWRGGERSASLATVLARIGWNVTVLTGGYKTYRAHVLEQLAAIPSRFSIRVLAGATGTGKTRLLQHLAVRKVQILDLERLTNHRGSILGSNGPQPPQRLFESRLLHELGQLDPTLPVWVEGESNRIGNRYVPKDLWERIRQSPGVELCVPMQHRVNHLMAEYAHLIANPEGLRTLLHQLAGHQGVRIIHTWDQLIDAGDWPELVRSLIQVHYDPAYGHSRQRMFPKVRTVVEMPDFSEASQDEFADRLLSMAFNDSSSLDVVPVGDETLVSSV